jgi:hypothetical protein
MGIPSGYLNYLRHYGANLLMDKELLNTIKSLMIHPNAANAGVSTREFVRPYYNPAAIDIVTTL